MNQNREPVVLTALAANAGFSALTGGSAVLFHGPISGALGITPSRWLLGIGVALLFFAAHLVWCLRRGPRRWDLLYFVFSDAAWVIGSIVLVWLFPDLLSADGRVAVALLAIPVAVLASLQALGLIDERSEGSVLN